MTCAPVGKQVLLQRLDGLREIPTVPAVLAPLLRYLEQPVEQLDVRRKMSLLEAGNNSLGTDLVVSGVSTCKTLVPAMSPSAEAARTLHRELVSC